MDNEFNQATENIKTILLNSGLETVLTPALHFEDGDSEAATYFEQLRSLHPNLYSAATAEEKSPLKSFLKDIEEGDMLTSETKELFFKLGYDRQPKQPEAESQVQKSNQAPSEAEMQRMRYETNVKNNKYRQNTPL